MNENIAIITARGGSKRIPRKNIKEFCGKPILQYSIDAALEAGIFEEVMVSTEDEEIAELSKKMGASVPFLRSQKNADDHSVTSDVIQEVVREYETRGEQFRFGCCIYPTAPFLTAQKLRQGMELLEREMVSTVLPIVAYSFPPQRGVVVREGRIQLLYPENLNVRSQDLEPVYHDCGQFYCFRIKDFMETGNLIGDSVAPLLMEELEVQDIDNPEDWRIAELKYQFLKERTENEI